MEQCKSPGDRYLSARRTKKKPDSEKLGLKTQSINIKP